uniref:4-Cys prefix domain-containing protein n=1 Tax=Coleofasciculus chthonoplastes TaxID=64178 RepID=UPI0036F1C1E8
MPLCINPTCPKPDTSENEHQRFCQSCGSQLLLNRFLLFFRTSLLIEVIAGDRFDSGFKV